MVDAKGDMTPPRTAESTADSGRQELEIPTLKFKDYIEKEMRARLKIGAVLDGTNNGRDHEWITLSEEESEKLYQHRKPDTGFYFSFVLDQVGKKPVPVLVAAYDPFLLRSRAMPQPSYRLFFVNNSRITERGVDQFTPFELNAYNVSLGKLKDPEFVGEVKKIKAAEILVPESAEGAKKINSWVADPELRARINEYAGHESEAGKYAALRRAPSEDTNFPGEGRYTYKEIVRQAHMSDEERKNDMTAFTSQDLEWLHAYMRNKGIPIPTE